MKEACEALNVPHSRVYRERQPKTEAQSRPTPAHALSDGERAAVREVFEDVQGEDNRILHFQLLLNILLVLR